MCNILYEDNHLLVVEKPPGMLTQGDATGDDCLVEVMKRYVGRKYEKPGAVYLGLVHRLDRPVGGLVVLARTSKAAARLSQQLREHDMQREYLTVVHGASLSHQGMLQNFLVKDAATGNVRVSASGEDVGKEGQLATLRYEVLSCDEQADQALLHIRLETGRKHQIRVQLAHAGHSIVQDMRYGYGTPGEPIALWGALLRLTHPTLKHSMTFISTPKGKAFDRFGEEVQAFERRQV